MSELSFAVAGAHPERYAVSPLLALRMRVSESSGVPVHAITLRAQVQIEPHRRRYGGGEPEKLVELFGGPERYGDTLKPMLWTFVATTVLAFEHAAEFDLLIPCSYDFAVAANKYFSALEDGDIPIVVQLSGTVFVRGAGGAVAAELVPWTCEARYQLPVAVWQETMDAYFPNSAWIRIDRETFDELYRFKREGGFPTWEAAISRLCARASVP
ncbi:MAG: DUF6084 family protein [Candidatus Elarobacter sp.]